MYPTYLDFLEVQEKLEGKSFVRFILDVTLRSILSTFYKLNAFMRYIPVGFGQAINDRKTKTNVIAVYFVTHSKYRRKSPPPPKKRRSNNNNKRIITRAAYGGSES